MHSTKLDRLLSEQPAVVADDVRQLSKEEGASLRDKLGRRLGLRPGADSISIERALKLRQKPLAVPNAQSDEFDLLGCIYFADIAPPERVNVNWEHLGQFDSVSLNVLLHHFDYFWYPTADYIDVVDDTCSWVLSIDYDGHCWMAKL
jgi:hypothetical protein